MITNAANLSHFHKTAKADDGTDDQQPKDDLGIDTHLVINADINAEEVKTSAEAPASLTRHHLSELEILKLRDTEAEKKIEL